MDRRDYEMSEAQYAVLLQACKPVSAIMLQCGPPPSAQDNANRAWRALGDEMGFDGSTAKPNGKGERCFSAVPKVAVGV